MRSYQVVNGIRYKHPMKRGEDRNGLPPARHVPPISRLMSPHQRVLSLAALADFPATDWVPAQLALPVTEAGA